MSITENSTIAEITLLASGEIQIMQKNTVEKDGEILSTKAHYDVLQIGSDVSDWPESVQKIAQMAWTPEVIAAYQASLPKVEDEPA